MAAKKSNLNIFKRVIDAQEVPSMWADAYEPSKYDTKNLYKTYKVPKFKKRFSI